MGYIEPNVNAAMTASMAIGHIASGNTTAATLLSVIKIMKVGTDATP